MGEGDDAGCRRHLGGRRAAAGRAIHRSWLAGRRKSKVPILILHGAADSPADGGSIVTNVQMARDFEAA